MATTAEDIDSADAATPKPEVQNGSANRNGTREEPKSKKPGSKLG